MTNNLSLQRSVMAFSLIIPFSLSVQFVEGSSLDVLIAARDAVHLGSRLLTHPLYGNLRPHQQPFRSVMMEKTTDGLVDLESLSMIEEAVFLYRRFENTLPLPARLPPQVREDYALVDLELMRESVERYGGRLAYSPNLYQGMLPENESLYAKENFYAKENLYAKENFVDENFHVKIKGGENNAG
jgi:hypothetical protein